MALDKYDRYSWGGISWAWEWPETDPLNRISAAHDQSYEHPERFDQSGLKTDWLWFKRSINQAIFLRAPLLAVRATAGFPMLLAWRGLKTVGIVKQTANTEDEFNDETKAPD